MYSTYNRLQNRLNVPTLGPNTPKYKVVFISNWPQVWVITVSAGQGHLIAWLGALCFSWGVAPATLLVAGDRLFLHPPLLLLLLEDI